MRAYRANHSLNMRQNAKQNSDYNRHMYNSDVAAAHAAAAAEHARAREAEENRIRELEQIE